MQDALTARSLNVLSDADSALILALDDNRLDRAREALMQGARPHFWVSFQGRPVAPVGLALLHRDPLPALSLLHEFGLREVPRATNFSQAQGIWGFLPETKDPALAPAVQWLLRHRIGLRANEGVDEWLSRALFRWDDDLGLEVLKALGPDGKGEKRSPMFLMAVLSLPGSAWSQLCNATSSEPIRDCARRCIEAVPAALANLAPTSQGICATPAGEAAVMFSSSMHRLLQNHKPAADLFPAFEGLSHLCEALGGPGRQFWLDPLQREEVFQHFPNEPLPAEVIDDFLRQCQAYVAHMQQGTLDHGTCLAPATRSPRLL